MALYERAEESGLKLATAYVHLHNELLMRLRGGGPPTITWCGPGQTYRSGARLLEVPALLEWGPHAESMREYLGGGGSVTTGWSERPVTEVSNMLGTYRGEWQAGDLEPLRCLLRDFRNWLDGSGDERFSRALAETVAERCQCPT